MMSELHRQEPFFARADELDRFRSVLAQVLDDDAGPDQGYLILVHGIAGIGKSTLLERYRRMLSAEPDSDRPLSGKFLVAAVDWEAQQLLEPREYPPPGPPLRRALEMIYAAITDAADASKDARRPAEDAFREFRERAAQAADRRPETAAGSPGPADSPGLAGGPGPESAQALGALAGAAALLEPEGRFAAGGARQMMAQPAKAPDRESRALGGPTGHGQAPGHGQSARHAQPAGHAQAAGHAQSEALTGPDDALARSFADGLRKLSRSAVPLVLSLDAAEVLGDALIPLFDVIKRSGQRVVWLVGMRLESDQQAPIGSVADLYLHQLHSTRLRLISPSRLTTGDVDEYLRARLGAPLPPGVTAAAVTRLSRGIPLAVKLAVNLLVRGMPPHEALREVTANGDLSEVVGGLAQRYLIHVVRGGASGGVKQDPDLDLIFGLALLKSTRDDPELLGALWQVKPKDVAAIKDSLSWRHDFVLRGEPLLHQVVRDTVLAFLLNPDQRARVRAANEHARQILRQRLAGLGLATVEAQLDSDKWCSVTSALLWHTLWLDDQEGLGLLAHLLPAALLLRPAFARRLLTITEHFSPVFSREFQLAVAGLRVLAPASAFLGRLHALFDTADQAGRPSMDRSRLRAAVELLHDSRSYPNPVLAPDIPSRVLLYVLQARYPGSFGMDSMARLALLDRIDAVLARLGSDLGTISQIVAACADELAQSLSISAGALEMAAEAAELATRRNPHRAQSWRVLADSHRRLEHGQEALAAYDQALLLDPDDAASHGNRGFVLAQMGHDKEALAAYDQAVLLDPDNAASHFERGFVLGRLGQDEEALAAYDQAVLLDPDNAASHFERGLVLGRLGRDDEALAAYDEAVLLDPDNAACHFERGFVLGRLGQQEQALADYDQAVLLDPGHAASHTERAFVLGQLGLDDEALAAYDQAVLLDPDNSASHFERAFVLARLGRESEALAGYDRAIVLDPDNSASHFERAVVLRRLGRDDESLAAYDQSVLLDPDNSASHFERAFVLERLGREYEALAAYDQVVRLDPENADAHGSRGAALERLGRQEEALAAYEQALRLNPGVAASHGNRAFLLGRLGRHQEALASYEQAVRLDPENAAAHGNRGVALGRLGRRKEALAAYDQALHLDPDDIAAHGNRGELLMFLGRTADAAADLRAAIRLQQATALEARVLLAVLIRNTDPAEAAGLCQAALRENGLDWSAFRRAELRALALLMLNRADEAEAGLRAAAAHHLPGDVYQQRLYELLADPPVPGMERLTAVWKEILRAQGRAVA